MHVHVHVCVHVYVRVCMCSAYMWCACVCVCSIHNTVLVRYQVEVTAISITIEASRLEVYKCGMWQHWSGSCKSWWEYSNNGRGHVKWVWFSKSIGQGQLPDCRTQRHAVLLIFLLYKNESAILSKRVP